MGWPIPTVKNGTVPAGFADRQSRADRDPFRAPHASPARRTAETANRRAAARPERRIRGGAAVQDLSRYGHRYRD